MTVHVKQKIKKVAFHQRLTDAELHAEVIITIITNNKYIYNLQDQESYLSCINARSVPRAVSGMSKNELTFL